MIQLITCIRYLAAVAVGMTIWSTIADADPLTDTLAYRDSARREIERVYKPRFRAHMNAHDQSILDQIQFDITTNNHVNEAYASRRDGHPVVTISVGYIILDRFLIDGLVMLHKAGDSDSDLMAKYESYIQELSQITIENTDNYASGKPIRPYRSFMKFLGYSEAEERTYFANPQTYELLSDMLVQSLSFVIAHEIGHHVLGHTLTGFSSASEQREREGDADAFATDLTLRSGFIPMLSTVNLMFFATIEEASNGRRFDITHPTVLCRIHAVAVRSKDQLLNDTDTLTEARKQMGDEAIDTVLAKFKDVIETTGRECS